MQLRPGSYQLRLWAPDKFLNRSVEVTIREGNVTTHQAPLLGRVNVRANPGNCTLAIDGMSAGAPPFMNLEVVTGRHEFTFTWRGDVTDVTPVTPVTPVTDVQTVTVEAEQPAYVIGQRP